MKNMILIALIAVGAPAFAESIVIEGKFVHRDDCNQVAPVNAVIGKISNAGEEINVCAEDVVTLTPEDFTNGATISALNDGKVYNIVGTLHEGTLSVNEVARLSE